jgi:nicotinamide-nucleotide amidase
MEILFIGKEWKLKKMLQEEILKKVYYSSIKFLEKLDIEFEPNEDTLILTNKKSYPLVAKILATLTNQHLILKENFLIPENAQHSKNSFLVTINNKKVNTLLVENEVPKILLPTAEKEIINIFKFDEESAKMFIEPILNAYKLSYTITTAEGGYVKIQTNKLTPKIKKEILKTIPFTIFGDIFEHIVTNLPPKKITFAESCTGGMLASFLTKIPGSSKCFDGSVVSYANEIKEKWLGVSKNILEKFGAVSEETVKEMLIGAMQISEADYAIAISGIAGPTGGTPTKPVGTVFIGVANKKEIKIEKFLFKGERNYIQFQAVENAIRMFINFSELYSNL